MKLKPIDTVDVLRQKKSVLLVKSCQDTSGMVLRKSYELSPSSQTPHPYTLNARSHARTHKHRHALTFTRAKTHT